MKTVDYSMYTEQMRKGEIEVEEILDNNELITYIRTNSSPDIRN